MVTKPKSNSIITHAVEGQTILFTVADVGTLKLNIGAVHVNNVQQATVHGFIQRISDAAAIPRNTETGQSATPQEKFDAMARLVGHYESGSSDWRILGAGGGLARTGGYLFAALSELFPTKSADEVRAWMKSKSKDELTALRTKGRAADIIRRMEAERSAGVDVDGLLGEMDD